jgi:hypothetical protein
VTEQLCGMKNAKGEPCILAHGHNPNRDWKYREHKTANDIETGKHFTYMAERDRFSRFKADLAPERIA